MKNRSQSSEQSERKPIPSTEVEYVGEEVANGDGLSALEEQMLLDYLIEMGFSWEEAMKLISVRTHLHKNTEMRERMEDDYRMHFARWLYEQGEIREA